VKKEDMKEEKGSHNTAGQLQKTDSSSNICDGCTARDLPFEPEQIAWR
jgi:hypothetical protein